MGQYVDRWGDVVEKKARDDWSGFEPWDYWQNEFEWIACKDKFREQDMIAFRDDVFYEHRTGSKIRMQGVRLIIARVASIDGEKAFLEIVHSEGEEAYSPETKITRKIKWLSQYGVQRWPRNHGPQDRLTEEQKELSREMKEKRQTARSSSGTASKGSGGKRGFLKAAAKSCQTAFRGRKKNTAKHQKIS